MSQLTKTKIISLKSLIRGFWRGENEYLALTGAFVLGPGLQILLRVDSGRPPNFRNRFATKALKNQVDTLFEQFDCTTSRSY